MAMQPVPKTPSKRLRSPPYPAISLRDAVERIRLLLERRGPGPMTQVEVLQGFGYTGVHGPSHLVLAAVRRFGLLSGRGKNDYSVTRLAFQIIRPSSPEERLKAMYKALRRPHLYRAIDERFPEDDWEPDEDELRSFMLELGYTEGAIARAVAVLEKSVDFVKGSEPPRTPENLHPLPPDENHSKGDSLPVGEPPFQVSFHDGQVAVHGQSDDAEAVERLIAFLQGAKANMRRSH